MRVLVSDSISDKGVEILRNAGLTVDVKTKLSPSELINIIGEYEGLVVRSATKVTTDVVNAAKKLKVVGRAGAGLDNIDVPASTKKGGKWEKNKFTGQEYYNKALGIVGMGRVGGHVAKLGQGLLMNVLAFDPYLSQENAQNMGVELVSLDEIYRRSDFITIHTPLTAETRNLIGAEAINKMKDGVLIINCARGGIVDETALYEGLKSNKIGGAAFDVFVQEPVDAQNPLLSLENFVCTPHLGASTTEAQENVALAIAEQMVDYITKGVIRKECRSRWSPYH